MLEEFQTFSKVRHVSAFCHQIMICNSAPGRAQSDGAVMAVTMAACYQQQQHEQLRKLLDEASSRLVQMHVDWPLSFLCYLGVAQEA